MVLRPPTVKFTDILFCLNPRALSCQNWFLVSDSIRLYIDNLLSIGTARCINCLGNMTQPSKLLQTGKRQDLYIWNYEKTTQRQPSPQTLLPLRHLKNNRLVTIRKGFMKKNVERERDRKTSMNVIQKAENMSQSNDCISQDSRHGAPSLIPFPCAFVDTVFPDRGKGVLSLSDRGAASYTWDLKR